MIDFSDAPDDALERIAWLGGVMDRAKAEVDAQFAEAYAQARLTGRLESAINLRLHSPKRILAFTRSFNEAAGRQIRWGDHR